jgi:hypothetical protein
MAICRIALHGMAAEGLPAGEVTEHSPEQVAALPSRSCESPNYEDLATG